MSKKLRLWHFSEGKLIPIDFFTDGKLVIEKIEFGGATVSISDLLKGPLHHGVSRDDADLSGRVQLFVEEMPCWFEGCDELRKAYFEEVAALEKRAEEQGVPCSNCDRGDIKRKYVALMREKGHPLYPNGSHRPAPGPDSAT